MYTNIYIRFSGMLRRMIMNQKVGPFFSSFFFTIDMQIFLVACFDLSRTLPQNKDLA